MRRIALLLISFTLFLLSPLLTFADFSESYIRLDRQKTSTATTGMVCAEPATTGTEDKVEVTFPSGYSVSGSTSNWSVSTSNIPSGATVWPGISNVTNVSGQLVTFPSDDLSVGTLYCFRWTNSSALTTSSTSGTANATITTKNSGNSTIDTSSVALTLLSADQLSVSATVAASATDFQADLSSSTTGSPFAPNTTINFQLDYGSYLTYASDITVEAEWSLGTISGSSTPSVDILDYVVGSASDGYGSTSPVIDLTNRKITWTLDSFPANTVNESVTFQLKTNSAYTGSSQVDFSVDGRVLGPGTQTTDSTVTRAYQYPASSSGPTATPTPGPTATPTPVPSTTTALQFTDVDIRTVSSEEATIFASTNKESTVVIGYGTSPSNLNQRVTDLTSSLEHLLLLGPLEAETPYYFRITATDAAGKSISSDLFSFTSAKFSEAPSIDISSVIFTSLGNIVMQPAGEREKPPFILLTIGAPYSFGFSVPDGQRVKRVQLFLRRKNVLGVFSAYAQQIDIETNSVDVIEIGDGNFRGRLKSPLNTGLYELYARIHDENGNIAENLVGEIKVTKPFTVLEEGLSNPVESARVLLSVFDTKERAFKTIPRDAFGTRNPSFTNSQGQLIFPLPPATYKAEILAIGYEQKEVEFTLGPSEGEEFPTTHLKRKPFSLIDSVLYLTSVYTDFVDLLSLLIITLSNSYRFFDLLALTVLALFVYLTTLALSSRLRIPFYSLLHHLKHRGQLMTSVHTENLSGKIYSDRQKGALSGADVFLLIKGERNIVAHTVTDASGKFFFTKLPQKNYDIQVLEEGHEATFFSEIEILKAARKNQPLYIHKHLHPGYSKREKLILGVKEIFYLLFETLLVLSFFIEIVFGAALGWSRALPFMFISFLNLILWLDHGLNQVLLRHSSA